MINLMFCGNDKIYNGILISLISIIKHTKEAGKVEKVEAVKFFLFLGSKITADDDCSHEIRRHLLLGGKVMTHTDSIKK